MVCACFFIAPQAYAATLRLSPDTGVYTAGATFTARVVVNTQGKSINAAEGELSFNPSDLSVVSISKAGSIFSLWTLEPVFSNSAGTISFGGGSPSGYSGSAGTVMTVTFKTKHDGVTNVSYAAGSILAADGKGTNVISGMQGGAYTVQATSETPQPEYVPPANTPGLPKIISTTHPDPLKWYAGTTAELEWTLPSGVTSVRTLLDESESTVPTKVYEEPIDSVSIPDLPNGVSYFHLQFRNEDGWGRVAHYRLGVDAEAPKTLTITPAPDNDPGNPEQRFLLTLDDAGSGVGYFMISIDGGEKVRFDDTENTGIYTAPSLAPGVHTIAVEAYDKADHSISNSATFTIDAFDAPVFTEYPPELPSSIIPVIKGTTRPQSTVVITIERDGMAAMTHEVSANDQGVFTFVPDGRFENGVYEFRAVARDTRGAQSRPSEPIRIAVQESGMVRIGGILLSALSVIVPLIAVIGVLILGGMYWFDHARRIRKRIRREAGEAEAVLAQEFDGIVEAVKREIDELKKARKGKLTKQEQSLVETLGKSLESAEKRVRKEIEDIEKLVKR